MNSQAMLDRLAAANPAPEHGLDIDDSALLLAIRERSVDMSTNTEHQATKGTPPPTNPQSPRRRSGWVVAAAAFAAVVVTGVAVVLVTSTGTGSESDAADAPPTTEVTPTTQALPQTVVDALAIKDAYIVAYNAGDADAVLALFEPDPEIFQLSEADDLDSIERFLVWSHAEGTTITASDCTTEQIENAIRVRCESTRYQHLSEAVGAPIPEGILNLTISADGISHLSESGTPQDVIIVYAPFERWLEQNHPEDFDARPSLSGGWDTVAEAEEAGILRSLYADEWAAYLDSNGCTYQDSDC